MAWLRGNLHAHTTYSDGVKTPQDLIAEYEALGYDFLAITDHEDLIGSSYWRAPPRRPPRPPLFPRGEGKYQGFDQPHRRGVGGPEGRPVPHHPPRLKLSVAGTPRRAPASPRPRPLP